jgi:predicted enzyme related to lactoylglutathione lyase
MDFPAGEYRWLTVVSPEEPDATQLVLEPNVHPATQADQAALHADGIPISTFEADDLIAEVTRLEKLGVKFTTQPVDVGIAMIAVFDDSCGNLIQLYETKSPV